MGSPKLAMAIVILLGGLLANARSIHHYELQRRENESENDGNHKTVWDRPIRVAPGITPTLGGVPERVNVLDNYQKECELGMFDYLIAPGPGSWSGFPFRGEGAQPGACFKIENLQRGLGNKISAFVVTGYCECEFFDDDSCKSGLFSGFNRKDDSLWTNGPHNNMIESVRCKPTDHIDDFVSGSLRFEGGTIRGPWNGGSVVRSPSLDFQITKDQLYKDCIPLPGDFPIASYKTNGVTCDFFKGGGCIQSDYAFTAGHGGKYRKVFHTYQYLKSFKCYPPYGIMWDPRDDIKPS
ncbi:hypothetical protein TWF281_007109 [Arthrobotrys megalospora]